MAVTLTYFAYLALASLARRRPLPLGVSLVTLGCVVAVGMPHVMPLIYLLIGYWVPALLVGNSNPAFEKRLLSFDHAVFSPGGLQSFSRRAPRIVLEYFELAYLLCYAVVPLGFAWLLVSGFDDQADMFWSTVLLASFACYGVLPWLATRAPRAVERMSPRTPSFVRSLNLAVLGRASVQWNTFPSGHTAASVATALAVGSVSPPAGLAFGVVALSIAVGSVIGRYHYAADALAGALVAAAAFVMATAVLGP